MTVANGTRPNLLWGSDLNLDGVDTSNKAAIEKHLGVGLGAIKVDDAEYFQYLKGGGVAGSDAVMFKSKDGIARWTFFRWEKIKVKPNTVYTMSAWVKFKPNRANVNQIYVGVNETVSTQALAFMQGSDKQYYLSEIKDWERRHWTFKTKDETLITVLFAHSGTDESLMWLCRPKLEEGDTATPWCAYDGTVEELLAGGFDIKNRKMIATADNFVVQNNKGEKTLLVDQNGKLNTKLINADEIFGLKIAQPFEAYTSNKELRKGKSLSWILEHVNDDLGTLGGREGFNGVTVNIFNNTGSAVSLWMSLITPFKYCQVDIPNNVMLRAIGVYRMEWDGCRWYPLCPWEDNGNGGIRIKAFG